MLVVTRIDIPKSALWIALAAFDGALPVAADATPATLTGLFATPLGRCVRTMIPIPGYQWRLSFQPPWPSASALVVEGFGDVVLRAYATFGRGRVGLPRVLIRELLAAEVPGVTAHVAQEGGESSPWLSTLGHLFAYLSAPAAVAA